MFGCSVVWPELDRRALTGVREVLLYSRFHVLVFVTTTLLVVGAPQTWEFTKTLTVPRVSCCMLLLLLSIVMMWTQDSNPFLYFRF